MSDINFTHCIIIGKKDDVKVIYDLFKKYEDLKNLIYGFVPLINLIDGLGCKVNKKHFNTTYKLHKLSDDGQRLDFYLQGRRGHPYFELEFLQDYFNRIELYYYSSNECFNYITNDKDGLYIKTKFVVDWDGEVECSTWNEVFDEVGQIVGQKISSQKELFQILDLQYEEDGVDEYITVTEVRVV